MESTGKPGRVHVSETTCKFLDDMYILEDGPMVEGRDQTILYTRTTFLDVTKHKFVCVVWGFHGWKCEDYCVLWYNTL